MSWKQVRPILDCLCQIFSFYGFSSINATQLYRAKFDRNEVTRPLWKLIYELLHFQFDCSVQIHSAKIFDETPTEKLVEIIRNQLNERGYQYEHIRFLDTQMERGSRSLLVCFAWLIHQLKFIDRCVENRRESMKINDKLRFWLENETTFWKWMESVLDDETPRNFSQLEAEREKFHAAIDTLDNALVRLEQLWISNDDRRMIREDFTSIIDSIDQQISSLFSQLKDFPRK